jgi:rhomboid protease GluP
MRGAPVTKLLLLSIAGVFVAEMALGGSTNPLVLLRLGANQAALVLEDGQWWRLLASTFLHIGFVHLLLNGFALFQLGPLVEAWLGGLRLLVIYFASGVAGSLTSVLWRGFQGERGLSAGASGAIFGILGALIAFLVRRHARLRPEARALLLQFLLWAGINVVFGFTNPGIDNAAHLGGFAAGLLLGSFMGENALRRPESE